VAHDLVGPRRQVLADAQRGLDPVEGMAGSTEVDDLDERRDRGQLLTHGDNLTLSSLADNVELSDLTLRGGRATSCKHAAVRFQAEHRFPGPVGAVVDVLVDPAFHRGLELPDLHLVDVVDQRDDGDGALLALRYAYVGAIDPIAARLLGGQRLTWLQELVVDRATGRGHLAFGVDGGRDRLKGLAEFTLSADGDDTVWALKGQLRVRVPLVGGTAERRIVAGFLERLAIEARHVTDRLRAGR
jgi:hypothetical protein